MAQITIGNWTYHQIQNNGERTTTNLSFKTVLKMDQNLMEVFIGRIPYNMYEDDLIPLFEIVGVVIQFRLKMDYSGRNRGFGYVTFLDNNDGHRAIAHLNNILVSSWCRLQLAVSKNSRRLFLANISGDLDYETVVDMIVEKVDPEEIAIANRNGCINFLIKFNSHRAAAISRKVLIREIFDFGPKAWANWDHQES